MEHLMQWNPESRPTAPQALKYSFFQIAVRTTDTGYISLPDTQVAHHQNHFNTRKVSLPMRYNSLDNENWPHRAMELAIAANANDVDARDDAASRVSAIGEASDRGSLAMLDNSVTSRGEQVTAKLDGLIDNGKYVLGS